MSVDIDISTLVPEGVKMSEKMGPKIDVRNMSRMEFHGLPIEKAKPVNDE